MAHALRPSRVTGSLLEQQVGDETLLYDESRHLAFCLNRAAYAVWLSCDGVRSPAGLAEAASRRLGSPVSPEIVLLALEQLERDGLIRMDGLIGTDASLPVLPTDLLSRRRLLGHAGAGAALLLPVVAAIATPRAAEAYNGCIDCSNAFIAHQAAKQRAHDAMTQAAESARKP